MKITRRQFLGALLSVGATFVLPVPLAQATPAQVNTAWKKLLNNPWYFDVNEWRTIVDSSVPTPQIRSDVFEIILNSNCSAEDLISEIEACYPLTSHFQQLGLDELSEAESSLADEAGLTRFDRIKLKRVVSALADDDDGWAAWIRLEGAAGLQRFKNEIADWLAEGIDWNECDYFAKSSTAQGCAMAFFQSMDYDTLEELGVAIIEGEHPGSSYYAAELHSPIDDANVAAEKLGLPFRFQHEASATSELGA